MTCTARNMRAIKWLTTRRTAAPRRGSSESWPTASIPMDNPYCSCNGRPIRPPPRRRKAATKIQAIQRGRLERRKLKADGLRRKRAADKQTIDAGSANQLDLLEAHSSAKKHNQDKVKHTEKQSSANEKLAGRRRSM